MDNQVDTIISRSIIMPSQVKILRDGLISGIYDNNKMVKAINTSIFQPKDMEWIKTKISRGLHNFIMTNDGVQGINPNNYQYQRPNPSQQLTLGDDDLNLSLATPEKVSPVPQMDFSSDPELVEEDTPPRPRRVITGQVNNPPMPTIPGSIQQATIPVAPAVPSPIGSGVSVATGPVAVTPTVARPGAILPRPGAMAPIPKVPRTNVGLPRPGAMVPIPKVPGTDVGLPRPGANHSLSPIRYNSNTIPVANLPTDGLPPVRSEKVEKMIGPEIPDIPERQDQYFIDKNSQCMAGNPPPGADTYDSLNGCRIEVLRQVFVKLHDLNTALWEDRATEADYQSILRVLNREPIPIFQMFTKILDSIRNTGNTPDDQTDLLRNYLEIQNYDSPDDYIQTAIDYITNLPNDNKERVNNVMLAILILFSNTIQRIEATIKQGAQKQPGSSESQESQEQHIPPKERNIQSEFDSQELARQYYNDKFRANCSANKLRRLKQQHGDMVGSLIYSYYILLSSRAIVNNSITVNGKRTKWINVLDIPDDKRQGIRNYIGNNLASINHVLSRVKPIMIQNDKSGFNNQNLLDRLEGHSRPLCELFKGTILNRDGHGRRRNDGEGGRGGRGERQERAEIPPVQQEQDQDYWW